MHETHLRRNIMMGCIICAGVSTGAFASPTNTTGGGAAFTAATGALATFPHVDGNVSAIIPDGSGGSYVGGHFVAIGGIARQNLAHITANGTVSAWDPRPNGPVEALHLFGQTLYVGGDYTRIGAGALARQSLAAINITTEAVSLWNPHVTGHVRTILRIGTTVYAGGIFTTHAVGRPQQRNLAAFSSIGAGAPTAWTPNPNNTVSALVRVNQTLYVGGCFSRIGPAQQIRTHLAALPLTGIGNPTAWTANANGTVWAMTRVGGTLYVGGQFTRIGRNHAARARLAAIQLATGNASAWDPSANKDVNTLTRVGSKIYVGGAFTRIGRDHQRHVRLAALSLRSGKALGWSPAANGLVKQVVTSGVQLQVGGLFTILTGP